MGRNSGSAGGSHGSAGTSGDAHGSRGGTSAASHGGEGGKRKIPTLLDSLLQTHFVEGQGAMLGTALNPSTQKRINAQQAEWDAQFALRKKIKPIRDPDKVDVVAKKKRTKQKQRGSTRTGTTTLSNAETLG